MRNISPPIITTGALAISSAINFFGVMVWVRALGPKEFGVYAVLSASALFLNSLLFEWVRSISGRLLYDPTNRFLINPAKSYVLFGITVAMTSILLAGALILLALGVVLDGIGAKLMLYIVVFCISEMALGLINSTSRVRKLYWQYFVSMVIRSVLVILCGFVFVYYLRQGAVGLALGTCIGQILTVLIIVSTDPVWKAFRTRSFVNSYKKSEISEIFSFGIPMMFSNGLVYFVSIVDRYIIAAFLGSILVGYYVAPLDLTNKTIGVLMLALNITFYPNIVRAYEDKGRAAAVRELDHNLTAQLIALALPIIIMVSYPKEVCLAMLGLKFYSNSSALLPALAISVAIRLLVSNYLMIVFQLEKRMAGVVIMPAISLVAFLPLAFFGLNKRGILGVALAAAVSQAITFGISFIMARKLMKINAISRDNIIIVTLSALIFAVLKIAPPPTTTFALAGVCCAISVFFIVSLLCLDIVVMRPIKSRLRKLAF